MSDRKTACSVYSRDPSIVARKVAGEVILVPIRSHVADLDSIYTLNDVAGRIWELIDGQRSAAEIRDVITAEFEVSPSEAEADVNKFLKELLQLGAVRNV